MNITEGIENPEYNQASTQRINLIVIRKTTWSRARLDQQGSTPASGILLLRN
jgi:hypothetical protein